MDSQELTSQEELDLDSSQIETEEATNGGSQSHSESVNLKVINSKTDRSVKTPDIVMQLIDKSNYRLFNPLQAGKYQALTGAKYPRLKWGKKSVKWPHNCFEQALKADDEPIYICKACGSVYKHPGCTGGGAGLDLADRTGLRSGTTVNRRTCSGFPVRSRSTCLRSRSGLGIPGHGPPGSDREPVIRLCLLQIH